MKHKNIFMKIEHIALWTHDLEKVKAFYVKYFGMQCNNKYVNEAKKFSSYFLSFKESSCRIELMHNPEIAISMKNNGGMIGYAHIAISVGSKEQVNYVTEQLYNDGYHIVTQPRTTGDGYYESLVEDCEGNLLEITE